MNKNKRNINDLAYLIPISALLLVVASQSIAYKQFILSDFKLIEIKIFIETLISGFLDQRTSLILQSTPFRIYWTASYTLCFIFGTLALIYCVVTFRDVLFEKKLSRKNALSLIAIFALIPSVVVYFSIYQPVGNVLHPWRLLSPHLLTQFFRDIDFYKINMDGYSLFISLIIALTVTFKLHEILRLRTRQPNEIIEKVNSLFTLIHFGAIMLVFNTIRLYSLLSWSYSFLDSGDQSIEDQVSSSANLYQIETIINSAVFIQALIYSLMLLALYIPAKYYISKTVKTWNEDGLISKESDSTNEKIKNLTSFSFSNNFTSYFAIVGPLLSGPAIDLLTQIISFI